MTTPGFASVTGKRTRSLTKQEKDDVADIIIDERPGPVEVEEPPSVNDRTCPSQEPAPAAYYSRKGTNGGQMPLSQQRQCRISA